MLCIFYKLEHIGNIVSDDKVDKVELCNCQVILFYHEEKNR